MEDELLTVEQVAEILKVTPYTVRRFLREKKIIGVKVGRPWRIRRSALRQFIEEGEQA
jgi:excisionase family DNA binding protein